MPLIALALLLLAGCAAPSGPWVVRGGSPGEVATAQILVAAAKTVTPDRNGELAAGGEIRLEPSIPGNCNLAPPKVATGCSAPGLIEIRWPSITPACTDLTCSALAHELCHLGLASGGGMGGPVDLVSDARADACALLVVQQYRRMQP